ncbi:LysR family transcriptional regulator [Pseudooceanicola albus]|uniref:LysR family transcriptional regulator n=1 Tax=Pseudooceanicola albus TaxID=2692189 RepID=UPI0013681C94|nr:LysR family transcriptional regulator [Pseudooceanicola albus]
MPIDPRHLRILLAVSRSGSFTAAAEELNMSQPAVSIAIAQLEDRVGLPLVIRDRKGAVPTPAGEVLLRRARTIETVLERAAQEVALHHHRIEGPLLIGGTPGALMSLVPPVMARLGAEGLHLPVSLREVRDEDLAGLLRGRRIDLALCTAARQTLPAGFEEHVVKTEPFLLVGRAGLGLPKRGLTVAEAAAYPWILPLAEGATRRHLEAVFLSADVPVPRNAMRCDSLATMKELLRLGDYITLLPASVFAAELQAGQLESVPLSGAPPARRLAAWRMQEDDLSPASALFLETARALATENP